jgi:hypothetical protein
MKTPLYHHP